MKKLMVLLCLVGLPNPVLADDYFYDNGVYVSLDANADRISREKSINFGASNGGQGPLRTQTTDWAGSPSLGVGYKFGDLNSIVLKGDWAGYSQGRSRNSPGTLFAFTAVDGLFGVAASDPTTPSNIKTDWDSDVVNLALEFERRLWSDSLGGVTGLVGFKYRYEGQDFNASHHGFFVEASLDERLREHLYGPYVGLGATFKPMEGSNLSINIGGKFGYLFKSAALRARDVLVGIPHAVKDDSSKGTAFTTVGLDLTYAMTKNLSVSGTYDFNFINKAAHILNNTVFALDLPSQIENSSVYTQTLGLKLTYRF